MFIQQYYSFKVSTIFLEAQLYDVCMCLDSSLQIFEIWLVSCRCVSYFLIKEYFDATEPKQQKIKQ